LAASNPTCLNCGAEVFWGFPRATDPCIDCGRPIGFRQGADTEISLPVDCPKYLPLYLASFLGTDPETTDSGESSLYEQDQPYPYTDSPEHLGQADEQC
jgi:hypothetical protein